MDSADRVQHPQTIRVTDIQTDGQAGKDRTGQTGKQTDSRDRDRDRHGYGHKNHKDAEIQKRRKRRTQELSHEHTLGLA